jgi:hypothetical protein
MQISLANVGFVGGKLIVESLSGTLEEATMTTMSVALKKGSKYQSASEKAGSTGDNVDIGDDDMGGLLSLFGITGAGGADLSMLQGMFQQQEAFQTALTAMEIMHDEKMAALTAAEDGAKQIRS